MNGTFFGIGGVCWGGEKDGCSLPLQREENREEDMWGIKKTESCLIEQLGFRREARAIELGGWRLWSMEYRLEGLGTRQEPVCFASYFT